MESQVNKTILIVEDEPKLAGLLSDYLKQANFETHVIDNGLEVQPWLAKNSADLIVLDLMLPGKDGLTICREIRQHSMVPIFMATAKIEEIDRLLGLQLGADDYLCKPFSYREIVARIQGFFRRQDAWQQAHNGDHQPSAPLSLDEQKYVAKLHDITLDLTAVEFKLLLTLSREPGRIFNREQLMSLIYEQYRVVSDRTIDSHVKKLRQKLHAAAPEEDYIHSVYGVGYKFDLP